MKTRFVVQSCGLEVVSDDMIARIKEVWVADGNRVKDINSIDVYVKPEERKFYYIINGEVNGNLDL